MGVDLGWQSGRDQDDLRSVAPTTPPRSVRAPDTPTRGDDSFDGARGGGAGRDVLLGAPVPLASYEAAEEDGSRARGAALAAPATTLTSEALTAAAKIDDLQREKKALEEAVDGERVRCECTRGGL